MTRPGLARLIVAVPLTLAVLLSAPTQRVAAGMKSARAGIVGSLGGDASLHRLSNGKIAFLGGSDEVSLDVINPDGAGLRRLIRCTTRKCQILDRVWSPDGRRIAFSVTSGILVMGPDGRHLHRLAAEGGELAWQPVPVNLLRGY